MTRRIFALLVGSLPLVHSTSATTTVGGIDFQDNAFADTLISSSGTFSVAGFPTPVQLTPAQLAAVLTDKDAATYAFSHDSGAKVQLGFTDNILLNGTGVDLALFEVGGAANDLAVSLTLGGNTRTYTPTWTGEQVADPNLGFLPFPLLYNLNVALVDLSDFGVAPGAALDNVIIGVSLSSPSNNGEPTVASLSLVAAINTASVPDAGSTVALFSLAIGLLGFAQARSRIAS